MNPEAFWEMSFGEVRRVIEAVVRKRDNEAARQAATAYTLANMIVLGVSNLFSKQKQHYPSPSEAFPGLFDGVDTEQDWTTMRENFHDAFPRQK